MLHHEQAWVLLSPEQVLLEWLETHVLVESTGPFVVRVRSGGEWHRFLIARSHWKSEEYLLAAFQDGRLVNRIFHAAQDAALMLCGFYKPFG